MKKLLFTLLIGITSLAYSQAPQKISYQGVARNASGTVLANQPIGIKFDIHQGSASGAIVFTETHTGVSTNGFGLFTTYIGSISNLSVINWATNSYFIEVSIDPNTGTFSSLGSQQLMSVPYALNAGSAPAPAVSFTNNILSVGGNTTTIPAGTTYTGGTGINVAGSTIINTAPDQTITITPAGSASVTGTYPNFIISTPIVQTYTAGNGIDISAAGVISNTLTPVTPTLSVTGNSISINPGNTQALPNYSLTQSGANIDLTQNGTSIATVTLTAATSTSLSAGSSNIILNQSGNAYTITPVTPTFTNSGPTTISGSFPNYTVNSVASPTTTLVQGNNVSLNQSGSTYTVSVPSPSFATNGPTSISGSYPNYTVNSTASPSTSLVAGNTNIQLLPGTNSYTLNAYTYSLTNNSNTLTLTNGAPLGYTSTVVVPVGPTYTAGPGISISSGTIINTSPGITPTITGTGNAFVGTSGNSYTVNVPTQTLTVTGNSVITSNLGGSATISPASLTYTSASNTLKLTDGLSSNTYTLNNYSAGTGIAISGSAPNFVITNTAVISSPTITGTGIASVTTVGNTYTVNVPAPTYTPANGVLGFGTNTIVVTPTLSLTGSTLTSGASTNSVNLSGFNGIYGGSGAIQTGSTTVTVGTNTLTFLSGTTANKPIANFFGGGITGTHLAVGHIGANSATIKLLGSVSTTPVDYGYVSGSTNGIAISGGTSSNGLYATNNAEVGVGTFTTGAGKFVITHTATQADPTMHLRETSGGLSRIKFSNTGVANRFFEAGASVNAADNFSAYSISFHDGTNYKSRFLIYGNGRTSINNLHTALTTFHVMDDNATSPGIATEGFGFEGQLNLTRNNPLGSSPTYTRGAVFGTQLIGKINFAGYDGSNYGDGAKIYARTTENVTSSNKGTELIFAAVPTGTNTNKDAFKINGSGNLEIISSLFIPTGAANGKVLTSDATGNVSWQNIANTSPWVQGTGKVYLNNSSDWVGIGTTTPNNPFQVVDFISFESLGSNTSLGYLAGKGTSPNNYYNTFTGYYAGQAVGTGTASGNSFYGYNAGANSANGNSNSFFGTSSGQSNTNGSNNSFIGYAAGISNTSGNNNTALGYNSGLNNTTGSSNTFIGNGADLYSSTQYTNATAIGYGSKVDANDALILGNSNTKVGIGVTQPSSPLHVANYTGSQIKIGNINQPALEWYWDVDATSNLFLRNEGSGTTQTRLYFDYNSGHLGLGSGAPGYKLTVIGGASDDLATIYAVNNATSTTSASHGVHGLTFSTYSLSAGVFGNNNSVGPSVYGAKSGTQTGIAGRFDILNTSNTADAVMVTNNGAGAAIHAVSGPTVTGSTNAALWIEGGHFKSTQATAPTASTASTSISFSGATYSFSNASDVKGMLQAVMTTTSSTSIYAGSSIAIKVNFSKPYSTPPVVVVTPGQDMAGMSVYVNNITTTYFYINIKNGTISTITAPSLTMSFNYMVIE